MNRRLAGLISASVILIAAGAAKAQTAPQTEAPAKADFAASRSGVDLANPLDPLAPMTIQARPMETAVFAHTALDHRFSSRDDVTGSLGFLCGLQPGHTESGGAAAYGSDPHGRFLGAKLSFAFR
ncbi:hypothetical protein [Phenylobacterium sp.]|jgi:hypothetical protein|uniref:hypothetical protein n=1 Tax=Phenylobacterium sp. TaxID=1871053 RepID=UPI002F41B5E3